MPSESKHLSQFQRRKRYLPHWEGPGETYFITFGLLRPPAVDLTDERIGNLVVGALRFFDGKRYLLLDYTVMPDHVHLILKPLVCDGQAETLARITHSLKSWLAHRINDIVGRTGPLWHEETYDRVLRDEEDYREKAAYIFNNSRRKGLVDDPAQWPWWGRGSGGGS